MCCQGPLPKHEPSLPPGTQNPMARCIMCCFKCCLWCLEKFIKFLNRNAYIMVSPLHEQPLALGALDAGLLPWPRYARHR